MNKTIQTSYNTGVHLNHFVVSAKLAYSEFVQFENIG